jgi:hypothetical protein
MKKYNSIMYQYNCIEKREHIVEDAKISKINPDIIIIQDTNTNTNTDIDILI